MSTADRAERPLRAPYADGGSSRDGGQGDGSALRRMAETGGTAPAQDVPTAAMPVTTDYSDSRRATAAATTTPTRPNSTPAHAATTAATSPVETDYRDGSRTPAPAAAATPPAAPAAPAAAPASAPAAAPAAPVAAAGTAERRSRSEAAPAPASSASPRPASARPGPRRVRLTVSRVDPWSAMKISFLLSVALGIAGVVMVFVLWTILAGMGVFDQINGIVGQVIQDGSQRFDIMDFVGLGRVLSLSIVIAVIDVILVTAIATLAAFLYNVSSALVGGVQLTLTDD